MDSRPPTDWLSASEALGILRTTFGVRAAKMRICERAHAGMVLARAEQFHIGSKVHHDRSIPEEFWWADGHEALEQDWVAGDFSTWLDKRIELKAFGVSFARAHIEKLLPSRSVPSATPSNMLTAEDQQVIERLEKLVPSAASSFAQAAMDIADEGRVSFRGSALELREALREVLDHLAPDVTVTASPDFKQEKDRPGPTMRQKTRFIMKSKRSSSDTPEHAVVAFEEAIARLTRAVYDRSSMGAHAAQDRETVVQIRRYVVAVFHDILGN